MTNNNKSKITILYVLVLFSLAINAQKRVDGDFAFKIKASSVLVSNIIGWAYDKTNDKWAGYYNVIMDHYNGKNNKTPSRIEVRKCFGCANITSLQIKEISCNNQTYYFLYEKGWAGYYEYPALRIDWKTSRNTEIYILEESDYLKMKNLEKGVNVIPFIYYCSCYEESDALHLAKSYLMDFIHGKLKKSNTSIFIKKEDENTIRLNSSLIPLIQDVSKFGEHGYFEIKASDYNKLFSLSSTISKIKKK